MNATPGDSPARSAFWVSAIMHRRLDGAGVPLPAAAPDTKLASPSYCAGTHRSSYGTQETRQLLTAMEGNFAELVKEAHRVMPIQKIAEILQRLISEEISIRGHARAVLEALVEWAQKGKGHRPAHGSTSGWR